MRFFLKNSYSKPFGFLILIAVFYACNKRNVINTHPEMVGSWRHITNNNEYQYIRIESDGRGHKAFYENGQFKSETEHRIWRIKNEILIFGRIKSKIDRYDINVYPTTATNDFIDGYDTISIGQKYMILNNKIYAAPK